MTPYDKLAEFQTRLAKLLSKAREVKVAKVDCDRERDLCRHHVIRSYPTMRLYPLQSRGTQVGETSAMDSRDVNVMYVMSFYTALLSL